MSGSNLIYYLLFALIILLGLWLGNEQRPEPGRLSYKRLGYVLIVSMALFLVAALRYGIGFDYISYLPIFEQIHATEWGALFTLPFEFGFLAFTKLLMSISASPVFLYAVYSALMVGIVAVAIYRCSVLPWLSFFLYVALHFYSQSMNLLRQALAAAIVLLAIEFLKNKRPVPYMALILLASSFHKTALIMIVVYFIAWLPLNKITISIYAAGTFLALLLSDLIMSLVLQFIYSNYQPGSIYYEGSSFMFVVVLIILMIAVLALAPKLLRLDKRSIVLLNCMVYGLFFSLLFIRHFILERFAVYFTNTLIFALPILVQSFSPALAKPVDDGKFRSDRAKAAEQKKEQRERRQIYCAVLIAVSLVAYLHFATGTAYSFNNTYPYFSLFSQEAKNNEIIPRFNEERIKRLQAEQGQSVDDMPQTQ